MTDTEATTVETAAETVETAVVTNEDGYVLRRAAESVTVQATIKRFEVGQQVYYVDTSTHHNTIHRVTVVADPDEVDEHHVEIEFTEERFGMPLRIPVHFQTVFADEREAYSYAYNKMADAMGELRNHHNQLRNWLVSRQQADDRAEFLSTLQPVGTVYPSEQVSVWADPNDRYGGAHRYVTMNYLQYKDGKAIYDEADLRQLLFVYKADDGTPSSGLLTEQLLLILLDRHAKLEAAFPHPSYAKLRMGLEMALEAQRDRVDDRVARGVMGEMKV